MAGRSIALLLLLSGAACSRENPGAGAHGSRTGVAAPSSATLAPPTAPAPTPRCATQDCKTGKIVDDGCVDDGKGGRLCASCVNACPPDP